MATNEELEAENAVLRKQIGALKAGYIDAKLGCLDYDGSRIPLDEIDCSEESQPYHPTAFMSSDFFEYRPADRPYPRKRHLEIPEKQEEMNDGDE